MDQLPTKNEYNDNVMVYWVPEREFKRGDSVKYAYTLSWYSARQHRSSLGHVEATRIVKKPGGEGETFFIYFAGKEFAAGPARKTLTQDVWASRGARITDSRLIHNPATGGCRLVLKVQWDHGGLIGGMLPKQDPAVEFRAFLKDGPLPVTETWSYTELP
jgi:glucans biosynthesis protein